MTPTLPIRPRVQSVSEHYPTTIPISFPEPQFHRATSYRETLSVPSHRLTHHHSQSNLGYNSNLSDLKLQHTNPSVASFASSYAEDGYYGSGSNETYDDDIGDLTRRLSISTLNAEEALSHFQAGELKESDQEWHLLVPPEARDALGKNEVQRQSVIFEIIKSEREYVADLEAVERVFIDQLRAANPPIISERDLQHFIYEVFGNLHEILVYHQQILAALYHRQREQHPLILSIADIFLDTTLKGGFRNAYETYIKNYPLAESHHRQMLKQRRAYENFMQSVAQDPRIRKRDLTTFLSRPVTRLPRLNLLLEQTLKLTSGEANHPDLETLPLILGILSDCIKSTQPGIEAAESKVKFRALCETIVYQKGEIIDMDLYSESRSLVYSGPVVRRGRSETGISSVWSDLVAALLDNYFILLREDKPNSAVKRILVSRPIPLAYLRLGAFDSPPEMRREKAEDGKLLESLRYQMVQVYPFTVCHASNQSKKYTLYATTDHIRQRWHTAFVDAIGVHKVWQDANMWFRPRTLTDGFFRKPRWDHRDTLPSPSHLQLTGKINCAVSFGGARTRFLVVGCESGIYVAPVEPDVTEFRWVLNYRHPTSLAALTTLGHKTFNRLVVHADSAIWTFSLDILARLALDKSQLQTLDASIERVGGNDVNIVFCKHIHLYEKALLIYGSKRRLGTSLTLHVVEALDSSELALSPTSPTRSMATTARSFRPLGEPGFIPKDAYDIATLVKSIGICTSTGVLIADPTNLANSTILIVPTLQDSGTDPAMLSLKARLDGRKTLGLVRVSPQELMVIYDEYGCYINNYGPPSRGCRYVKWETKAVSYTHRNGHILLISPEFIEVRNITTGRIVQVIEGHDIRLLSSGPHTSKSDPVLVAMCGGREDQVSVSEKIVELNETQEIVHSPQADTWDGWDM
ncbi:hypothetical protein BYT27DRAFT_7101268 [Phlegmacium glaucopus]|nr:hypothetical protein BYT27DRAFT_7101268 [Phlegmacium glaucopus]